ncbi:hypothetical protein U0070_003705, partial [Myodes glareolus]
MNNWKQIGTVLEEERKGIHVQKSEMEEMHSIHQDPCIFSQCLSINSPEFQLQTGSQHSHKSAADETSVALGQFQDRCVLFYQTTFANSNIP